MKQFISMVLVCSAPLWADFSRDLKIVTDTKTGLLWQDNTDAKYIEKNWTEAIRYCENLSFAGYDDWRLPNIIELKSIVDYSHNSPSIDPTFQNTSSYYWSSTTYAGFSDVAWYVDFGSGDQGDSPKSNSRYVRCVRAGQFFDPLSLPKVSFVSETPDDNTVQRATFTKQWQFDRSLDGYSAEVISSDFSSYGTATIDDTNISMTLTPNMSLPVNTITLKLKDASGNSVSISGSQTFWATNRTNHAPRLADGQITQLVSATNEPAFLEVATYDADGDTVTLSIEDDTGGYVGFDPDNAQRIFASFSDAKVHHSIKIGLNDGKETVIKTFNVLQFNQTSIESFYSDVSATGGYIYDGIAFGTLKGVVWGQPDPNDATKRIFRPTNPASLAETLKIVINAEVKAGLVSMPKQNLYREAYPEWAMPYYTFAVDRGALDKETFNLSRIYPTHEAIAKLIVETLSLEQMADKVDTNITFADDADFSDDSMRHYAKIAHAFGLFMTGSYAHPQETISRADLAMVIEKIFMIPSATLSLTPATVEYGDTLNASLSNVDAEAIDASDYSLYDASAQLQASYLANGVLVSNPINSSTLAYTLKTLYAVLDNNGVKNVISTALNITFTDQDGDGVQDRNDSWATDNRYAYDDNSNGIPDILDTIYGLATYGVNNTIDIDGYTVRIADLISSGGWFAPDLDGDGISDNLDPDIDGDGVVNVQDAFPRDASEWLDTDNDGIGNNADTDDDGDGVLDNNDDLPLNPNEWLDTDHDGTGNNADTDDDNDGISDADENKWGFNPLDASDGGNADTDGDGVSNADEIEAGSDPLDPDDTKKPKRFVPIMMDDMVIMVPLVD